MIDLNQIASALRQRSEECFPACKTWTASDWFLELSGEVGEAANVLKKLNRNDENRNLLRANFETELADIFLCTLLNANHHGINLEAAAFKKFNLDSLKRNSRITLDPNTSIQDLRVYGLDMAQIRALINFYRERNGGIDPIGFEKE